MTLAALIARLTELDGKASKAPWRKQSNGIVRNQDIMIFWDDDGRNREHDYPLIAEVRNALPILLEALVIQREALEYYAKGDDVYIAGEEGTCLRERPCELFGTKAREAIARVDALAGREEQNGR